MAVGVCGYVVMMNEEIEDVIGNMKTLIGWIWDFGNRNREEMEEEEDNNSHRQPTTMVRSHPRILHSFNIFLIFHLFIYFRL